MESRLHYLFTGERDIFIEVDEAEEIDTAIVLLCDVSGSMDGARIGVACNALLAAAMAFAAVPGVALASATFLGLHGSRRSASRLPRRTRTIRSAASAAHRSRKA